MEEERALTDVAQVKAAMHPLREKMLEALIDGPATATEVARRVGVAPNKAAYHMQVLEKAGLVVLTETRSIGGVTEKYFARTARRFRYDPKTDAVELNDALAVVRREFNLLLADMQAALATYPEDAGHVSIQKLRATADQREHVSRYTDHLLKQVDEAIANRPGKQFRLILAWVPVKQEEGNKP